MLVEFRVIELCTIPIREEDLVFRVLIDSINQPPDQTALRQLMSLVQYRFLVVDNLLHGGRCHGNYWAGDK